MFIIFQFFCKLIYPSAYEGFGIPILESLSLGTPVVASGLEVFKESFGELPVYFKLNDPQSFENALEQIGKKEIPEEEIIKLKNKHNFENPVSILLKAVSALKI